MDVQEGFVCVCDQWLRCGCRTDNLPGAAARASLYGDHGDHSRAAGAHHCQQRVRHPDACKDEGAKIQDEHSEPRDHADDFADRHRDAPQQYSEHSVGP